MSESRDWLDRFADKGMYPIGEGPKPAVSAKVSEKEFMAEVVKVAKSLGWKVYHTHDSRKSEAGFPDLVLARDRVIFAELKTEAGKFSAAQLNWLDALDEAGAVAQRWRPEQWAEIVAELTR